jgi:hypothetical protein
LGMGKKAAIKPGLMLDGRVSRYGRTMGSSESMMRARGGFCGLLTRAATLAGPGPGLVRATRPGLTVRRRGVFFGFK